MPLACLSACTLVVGTSGLHGGAEADAGPRAETTGPPIEGGARDASLDDAPTGTSPCAAPHAFCDDFDTGTLDLASRWDGLVTGGGPLGLDTARAKSPPRSLKASLEGRGSERSAIAKTVAIVGGSARVELDFFVPSPTGSFIEVDPIGVGLAPPPAGFAFLGFYLVIRGDETFVQFFGDRGGNNVDNRVTVVLAKNAWHHLAFTFSYAQSPPQGSFSVDGLTYVVPMVAAPTPSHVRIELGAPYADGIKVQWGLSFDNVVLDTP